MTAVRQLLVVVPAVVACALGLGGCRGGDRAALPAEPAVSTPAATAGTSLVAGPAAAGSRAPAAGGDPLAGIESEVEAVERGVGADAGSAVGPAPRR